MAIVPNLTVTVRVEAVPWACASSNASLVVDSNSVPYWGPLVIETAPQNPWMGNCPACGHRYSWDDKQCGHCGAQLPAEQAGWDGSRPEPMRGDA